MSVKDKEFIYAHAPNFNGCSNSLDCWIDTLPLETKKLIVIDACDSGSFITTPDTISSTNRIIITSAREGEDLHSPVAITALSHLFWLQLQEGGDIYHAFINMKNSARYSVASLFGFKPLFDDNGDSDGSTPEFLTEHFPTSESDEGWVAKHIKIGSIISPILPLPKWKEIPPLEWSESLPKVISLDNIEISRIISFLTKDMAVGDRWPVSLKASVRDYNLNANIVVVSSKDPITKYKLVRIKTNSITDPRDLKLSVVLPSSSLQSCIKTYIPKTITDWITNFGQELTTEILFEITTKIAGTALEMKLEGVSFLYSIGACVEEGYAEPLEEWKYGEDYLVYLPVDLHLTLKVERGICNCEWTTSPWITCKDCPNYASGAYATKIFEDTNEVFIDIQETNNWWAKTFKIDSPGEIRVYNSQGLVTGLVDGLVKEEIPNSVYDKESKTVGIFFPTDSFLTKVVGTNKGSYGLTITYVENSETTTSNATDIPTTLGQIHQYTINWSALSQGAQGVTLQIDANGDGAFEKIITSDSNLTYDEFTLQTNTTVDFKPDTLNLKSNGEAVTAYIELPKGFNVTQINVSSIRLNGTVPAQDKPTRVGDFDADDIPDLMVKFNRSAVQDTLLQTGEDEEKIQITLSGNLLDGRSFKGSDFIRLIYPEVRVVRHLPAAVRIGDTFNVSLNIDVNESTRPNVYVLYETIPEGFDIVSTGSMQYTRATRTLKLMMFESRYHGMRVEDTTITYWLKPIVAQEGRFDGYVRYDGDNYRTTGDMEVRVFQ